MQKITVLTLSLIAATANAGEEAWQESVLKPEILEKVFQVNRVYRSCVGLELSGQAGNSQDSRVIADTILKKCEPQLTPMRDIFLAEKVPTEMADRYLRKTRTEAARNLIREVMGMQAVRQAGSAPR